MQKEALNFVAEFRGKNRKLSESDFEKLAVKEFRDAVFSAIYANNDLADRLLLTQLLLEEIRQRREGRGDCETLLACAYLLASKRELTDVLLLGEAKNTDFDTHCGLDVQLLVFAGVDETLKFLGAQSGKMAKDAAEYIAKCRVTGDFDNLNDYSEHYPRYFGFVH